jgi:hypothetical protein
MLELQQHLIESRPQCSFNHAGDICVASRARATKSANIKITMSDDWVSVGGKRSKSTAGSAAAAATSVEATPAAADDDRTSRDNAAQPGEARASKWRGQRPSGEAGGAANNEEGGGSGWWSNNANAAGAATPNKRNYGAGAGAAGGGGGGGVGDGVRFDQRWTRSDGNIKPSRWTDDADDDEKDDADEGWEVAGEKRRAAGAGGAAADDRGSRQRSQNSSGVNNRRYAAKEGAISQSSGAGGAGTRERYVSFGEQRRLHASQGDGDERDMLTSSTGYEGRDRSGLTAELFEWQRAPDTGRFPAKVTHSYTREKLLELYSRREPPAALAAACAGDANSWPSASSLAPVAFSPLPVVTDAAGRGAPFYAVRGRGRGGRGQRGRGGTCRVRARLCLTHVAVQADGSRPKAGATIATMRVLVLVVVWDAGAAAAATRAM